MSASGLVAIGNFYTHVETAYEEISGKKLKLSDSLENIAAATFAHIDVCDLCQRKITEAPGSYEKIKEVVQHTLDQDPIYVKNIKEPYCVCTLL